jgi:2-phosphosulfolactate phosphatase
VQLFVYHTPEATPTDHLPDCAVVIDVLRATTTIATALNAGADSVQAFSDIDKLLKVSESWDREKRLRAGERGGETVAGCDLGNSPLEFTGDRTRGRRIFISTTNGTRALQRVEQAKTVITAAQVNRQAVVNYLQAKQPEIVWLVGSGWQGGYSLEDTACAGAIAQNLDGFTIGNDEVIAAIALFEKWQDRLVEMFKQASHGQRLLRLDGHADLDYCARTDILETVPIQTEPGVLVSR